MNSRKLAVLHANAWFVWLAVFETDILSVFPDHAKRTLEYMGSKEKIGNLEAALCLMLCKSTTP